MSAAATLPGQKKKPPVTLALPYWLREFALIRWGVVALAASIGVGVAAVASSNWYLRDAAAGRDHAQQARDAAYTRFALSENEKREIRTYQPQFLDMRSKGLVGEENRLNWLDAIRQIQEQRRLLPLSYEIAPQQPVALDSKLPLGDYQLRSSRMNLRMDLLHELDLFNFFDDLRLHGYFAVESCTLKRLTAAANVSDAPAVSADCTLNWPTLLPLPGAGAGAGAGVGAGAGAGAGAVKGRP